MSLNMGYNYGYPITMVTLIITPLITAHEPPSTQFREGDRDLTKPKAAQLKLCREH